MKQLNEKIKSLREEKKWSLREMAAKIPMSHTAYRKIEDGDTQPAWDRIARISQIHRISPSVLIQSKSVTKEHIEQQNSIDDIFEVLQGINLEMQKIKHELEVLRSSSLT